MRLSIAYKVGELAREYGISSSLVWRESTPEFPPWEVRNIRPCDDIIRQPKNSIPDPIIKRIYTNHLNSHGTDEYKIYTDGAKTSDGVAFAMVGIKPPEPNITRSSRIHNDSSIFTAELYAILSAVQAGAAREQGATVIISDSKSSIQAVGQLYSKNPLINEIKDKAYNSNKNYRLCWVPSHRGVIGNEMADRLAGETTKNGGILDKPFLRADLESVVRAKTRASWLLRWTSIGERLNHFREVTDTLSPLPTSSENRRWEIRLARLRLGYTRLTHGYWMSQGERPVCEECTDGALLTVKHILVECQGYSQHRRRAFGREPVQLREILNKGDTAFGGSLYKYVNSIGIYGLI